MLKISKKLEYSLICLKHFWEKDNGAQVQARELCESFKMPFDTTAKVLQLLNGANILGSHQGVKGGYFLSRPLNEVSFFDVYVIIEGNFHSVKCQGDGDPRSNCERYDECNISFPLTELNNQLMVFFKQLSLEELFSGKRRFFPFAEEQLKTSQENGSKNYEFRE